MKMQTLVDASPAIRKLAGKELPLRISYALSRLIRRMDEHLAFYDERFRAMLEEHCRAEEGGWVPRTPDDREALSGKQRELLELEADMGEFQPVTLPEGLALDITAADLIAMEPFITIIFEEEK